MKQLRKNTVECEYNHCFWKIIPDNITIYKYMEKNKKID